MQFKDVIGQQALKEKIVDLFQKNRLAHALLFNGNEGSGNLALAVAFAQYLVCDKVNKPALPAGPSLFGDEQEIKAPVLTDSCGTCPSCIKVAQLAHPDVHFSYPVVTKKAGNPPLSIEYIEEWRRFFLQNPYGNTFSWLQYINAENKQGNITAAECNHIIKTLSLKSFEGGYKILIMWMPEYMGHEGNKLLKLIEEPPPKTVFLLVSNTANELLETIISRCQLIKVPAIDEASLAGALINNAGATPETARQVAAVSDGNYFEALQLIEHIDGNQHTLLRNWMNTLVVYKPVAQIKVIEEIAALGREKQKQFLKYFIHCLQLSIRLLAENNTVEKNESPEMNFAQILTGFASIEQQNAIAGELTQTIYYIERNANPKIQFQALSIKITNIIKNNFVFLVQ